MQALHIVNKIRIVFAWFAAKVAFTRSYLYLICKASTEETRKCEKNPQEKTQSDGEEEASVYKPRRLRSQRDVKKW